MFWGLVGKLNLIYFASFLRWWHLVSFKSSIFGGVCENMCVSSSVFGLFWKQKQFGIWLWLIRHPRAQKVAFSKKLLNQPTVRAWPAFVRELFVDGDDPPPPADQNKLILLERKKEANHNMLSCVKKMGEECTWVGWAGKNFFVSIKI